LNEAGQYTQLNSNHESFFQNDEIRTKGRKVMKRFLLITGLLIATVGAFAASCTEGNIKLTGETCGVVDGHCACTGNGN
jgi:hypothetical protein